MHNTIYVYSSAPEDDCPNLGRLVAGVSESLSGLDTSTLSNALSERERFRLLCEDCCGLAENSLTALMIVGKVK